MNPESAYITHRNDCDATSSQPACLDSASKHAALPVRSMTANHGLPPDFPERRTRAQPAEPPFAAAMYRVRRSP
ncbi:hypothetical protein BG57_20930 [Caballeronia grimmiae]|uniref:Uncharacterized protein n=1 Tax=Caballeronia grimmiae TaxID=1071679 RepID=A0A069P6U4_9BURK|nr:hypothetical protein BG57_20930 [Caballeronia grimmiae]